MIRRCEPRKELRGVDGWHWLTGHNPVLWIADRQEWQWGEDDWVTPEAAYRYDYRYLAPVATRAEVDALRAQVERLKEALHKIATSDLPDQRADIRLQGYARAALTHKEPGNEG
jgi:hypothetical protein